MAAYAALTSLPETTERLIRKIIIQSTVHCTFSRKQELESEIESLHKNTDFLRSSLEKSPTHPFEAEMKDAAEQAQVIIERFVDDEAILESLSHQLRRINEDLISPMVEKIRSNDASDETLEGSFGIFDSWPSRNSPLTSEDAVVGVELYMLSSFVFYRSSAELHLVVILGMGGIGKTTLARSLYNSTLTLEQFEVIGWVTVSRDFSARDLLVSLMASIQPFIRQPKQRDESIENHIHKNLKGRRFLIVLDDVWSPEALRLLMRTFPDDGNGSRILITTRMDEVASDYYTDPKIPTHVHTMRMMSAEESYELLVKKLFQNRGVPLELVYRLKNLATVCGVSPLALALVAGILLASNKHSDKWDYVFRYLTDTSHDHGANMVDTILSLSYKHLPHRLRSCLLYLGSFPKDHEINVVKQLSAQGFRHKSTSREVGQCVQYLVNWNLVSALRWGSGNGIIRSVCVHDMVRDFCLEKAREEKFLHCVVDDDDSNHDLTGGKIKVSFNLDNLKRICISDENANDPTHHTIMCFGRGRTRSRHLASIGRLRLLKSLDLANVEIESFPNEVLNLVLLRLLALGHVPELPPSLSNLGYLETLIVNDAKDASSSSIITIPRILCLPLEIWTISGLRHIVSFCCGELPSLAYQVYD